MQPAARTNLTETAIQTIRSELVSKRWAVGERLPNEATLADMLAVSRGTVREAVRVLVSQGFLETRQGSGTYVCSVIDPVGSLQKVRRAGLRDQFEVRCALEVEAARLAAIRSTPTIIKELRDLLHRRGEYSSASHDDYIDRDFAFHKAMIAASGNRAMADIYAFFSASIQETIKATLAGDLREPSLQAHSAIVDAIATGDPDRAAAAVRAFMAPVLSELDRMLAS